MSDRVYRVLVIGTGFGRRVQMPAFSVHDRFDVVAVASGRAERAREAAAEFDVPHHGHDWRRLLERTEPDVVSVVTPVVQHQEQALASLEAGCHLLLEKPVALNADEARQILRAHRAAPGAVAVHHEFRYRPDVLTAQRMIGDGRLGELRGVEIRDVFSFWADPDANTHGWLSEADQGGGLLGAIGSHDVDFVRFLTGRGVRRVQGATWTTVPRRRDAEGTPQAVTADDSASFLLELDGAVRARVDIAAGWWDPEHRIRVHGSRGSLALDDAWGLTGTAWGLRWRPAGGEPVPMSPDPDLHWTSTDADGRRPLMVRLLDRFARRCDGETVDDLATLEEGVEIMEILDAVRSGETTVVGR